MKANFFTLLLAMGNCHMRTASLTGQVAYGGHEKAFRKSIGLSLKREEWGR